jgi:hypothetical protein
MQVGEQMFTVGDSAENVFSGDAPAELVQQLLEARLEKDLSRKLQPHVSETEVARDWTLLREAMNAEATTTNESDTRLTARSAP